MPTRRIGFGAVGITGNKPGTLDYIPTKYINHGDLCIVHENGKLYFYRMDIFRGGAHNPPYVVKCQNLEDDTSINASLKKWFLISQELYSTNIVQYLAHYFKTYEIRAHSNEDLIFTTGLGENIVIQSDGKVILPSTASGLDPVNDTDFVTKQYLQNLLPREIQGEKCFAESDEWEQEGSLYKCELDLSECVEVEPISDDRWELWTTGANYNGECGVGDNETIWEQPKLVLGEEWEEIIPDLYRTFGIKKDGTLWACGWNGNNFLGIGESEDEILEFTQIGNAQWKQLNTLSWGWGLVLTLGIQKDGTLWSWGNGAHNDASKLGHGGVEAENVPKQVGTDTDWNFVTQGNDVAAALKNDGTLWVTGWNGYYQLGLGHTNNTTTFQQVGTDTWKLLSIGNRNVSFGIKTNGTLWGWGSAYNVNNPSQNYGTLGLGESVSEASVPTQIGSDTWKFIHTTWLTAWGIKEDGTLWSWGYSSDGLLGLGLATDTRYEPTQIGTDSDWKSVQSDGFTVYAMKEDNTVWSWGYSDYNYAGHEDVTHPLSTPTKLGPGAWKKIITFYSGEFGIGLKFDGSVWGWGGNWNYQMGIGEQYGIPFQRLNQRTWNNVWAGPTQVFYQEKILEIENEICQTISTNSNASGSSAIDGYGRWWAWGQNFVAQAGAGYFEFNAEKPYEHWFERYDKPENYYVVSPRLVENVEHKTDFVKINQGEYGQMAMDSSGRLWGFGQSANSHDAEGNCAVFGIPHGSGYNETGTIFGAVHCAPGHTFKDFAYNYYYTHMIGHDDKLYGMGYEYGYAGTGGFGIGYRIEEYYETPTLIPAVSDKTIRLILASDDSGMGGVVTTDGRVLVWGAGAAVIVDGYDANVQYVVDITDNLPEDKEILMIKASYIGIVALLDDGTAWARIGYGYLAGKGWDGSDDPYEWAQIENIPKIRYIGISQDQCWALDLENNLWTWGSAFYGAGKDCDDYVNSYTGFPGIAADGKKFLSAAYISFFPAWIAIDEYGVLFSWGGWSDCSTLGQGALRMPNYETENNILGVPEHKYFGLYVCDPTPCDVDEQFCFSHKYTDIIKPGEGKQVAAIDHNGRLYTWGYGFEGNCAQGNPEYDPDKSITYTYLDRSNYPERILVVSPQIVKTATGPEDKTDWVKVCLGEVGSLMAIDIYGQLWAAGIPRGGSAYSGGPSRNCASFGLPNDSGTDSIAWIEGNTPREDMQDNFYEMTKCTPDHTWKDFWHNWYFTHMIGQDDKLYFVGDGFKAGMGYGEDVDWYYDEPTLVNATKDYTVRLIGNSWFNPGAVVTTDDKLIVFDDIADTFVDADFHLGYEHGTPYELETDAFPEGTKIIEMVADGYYGLLVLLDNGDIWGRGWSYLLGREWGEPDSYYEWVKINIPAAKQIGISQANIFAVDREGYVWVWGGQGYWGMGIAEEDLPEGISDCSNYSPSIPTMAHYGRKFLSISACYFNQIWSGIDEDGLLVTWGSQWWGPHLGIGVSRFENENLSLGITKDAVPYSCVAIECDVIQPFYKKRMNEFYTWPLPIVEEEEE